MSNEEAALTKKTRISLELVIAIIVGAFALGGTYMMQAQKIALQDDCRDVRAVQYYLNRMFVRED